MQRKIPFTGRPPRILRFSGIEWSSGRSGSRLCRHLLSFAAHLWGRSSLYDHPLYQNPSCLDSCMVPGTRYHGNHRKLSGLLGGMSSGSGIPQVQGEMKGYLNQNWLKVILAKIIGGTLCIIGGLSLGREGPSVQLGAIDWKRRCQTHKKERYERTLYDNLRGRGRPCRRIQRAIGRRHVLLGRTSKELYSSMLVCVITGCAAADFVSKYFFGLLPVFDFHLHSALPLKDILAFASAWNIVRRLRCIL